MNGKLYIASEIGVPLFGISAIILLAFDSPWGFVAGLCGQPFFYIIAFIPKFRPGFFIAVNGFTFSWILGIYKALATGWLPGIIEYF